MRLYDFFNPSIHRGDLPVRVLPYNFLEWFQNITPDFKRELNDEIDFRELKAGIIYHVDRSKIYECALINPDKQIELFENFNQYLWSISYSLLVLFQESIQKPSLDGSYNGKLNLKNIHVKRAVDLFNNAFDLLQFFKDWQFYQLPNPEKYNEYEKEYIEKANGIYTAAMTFILLHEFAHQYYGHLEYQPENREESVKDEYSADKYAIEQIANNFSTERAATLKFGVIAGLCSLILMDSSLNGGDEHPDIDERLKTAMGELQLNEMDNLWVIPSLAFQLWAVKYSKSIILPTEVTTPKQLFELTLESVKETKF